MFSFSHSFKKDRAIDDASANDEQSPADAQQNVDETQLNFDYESTAEQQPKPKSKIPHVIVGLVLAAGVIVLALQFAIPFLGLQSAEVEARGHIEYAQRFDSDLNELLVCTPDQATFTVKGDIDATSVGTQDLPIEISVGPLSKEAGVPIQVKDTQPPEISLAKDTLTVSLGDEIKSSDIIKTITDPVDGDLSAVKDEPNARGTAVGEEVFYDEGWYRVEGLESASKAGSHTITVVACDRHGNRTTKTIKLEVTDPLEEVVLKPKTDVLEYSKEPVDPTTLVTCSDDKATIEADKLDLSTLGKKDVKYKLSKDKSTREVTCTFTVRDTKKPSIQLNDTSPTLNKGEAFDPYSNVKSVTDEVDGDLPRVDSEPGDNGEGWFTITGAYDVNKPGKYPLTVVACDRNGNRAEQEYNLEVKEPPAPAETPASVETLGTSTESANAEQDYVLNWNTKKFHYPGCQHAKRIKDKNREDVHMDRNDIVGMGFSPCAVCNP